MPHLQAKLVRRADLDERFALLTGHSVPIFRCGRESQFNAYRHALDDQ